MDKSRSHGGRSVVLVHGAYHGGWCWARVVEWLRRIGVQVSAPTLTGLGERAHLLSDDLGFETHVQDVIAHLRWEGIQRAILVGHSYGGSVAHAVADRIPAEIECVIYLDSANFDVRQFIPGVHRGPQTEPVPTGPKRVMCFSVPDMSTPWGVADAADVEWLRARLTPQPARTILDEHPISNSLPNGVRRAYIACLLDENGERFNEDSSRRRIFDKRIFSYTEILAPHDAMITHPRLLAETIFALSESRTHRTQTRE